MAKKHKCPDGVPEWIVTYGDMMNLLLCFFILLAAFSEPKKDRELQKIIQSIKEAFGFVEGGSISPTLDSPPSSLLAVPEAAALFREKFKQLSTSEDPGVEGKQVTVQAIREGLQFRIGGFLTFEPGSAELKEQGRAELIKVATQLRGKNNKVEIRGHASNDDLPPGTPYKDLWDLSYARAQAIRDLLADPALDIAPERIRLIACANNEPLKSRAYDPITITVNRRVEIIVIEALTNEFQAESPRAHISEANHHGG
jgi:chemotaxis protein MotB